MRCYRTVLSFIIIYWHWQTYPNFYNLITLTDLKKISSSIYLVFFVDEIFFKYNPYPEFNKYFGNRQNSCHNILVLFYFQWFALTTYLVTRVIVTITVTATVSRGSDMKQGLMAVFTVSIPSMSPVSTPLVVVIFVRYQ